MKHQMILSAFLLFITTIASTSHAAEAHLNKKRELAPSTRLESGRFGIYQSKVGLRLTFMLDKKLGQVWNLVSTADNHDAWELMKVQDPAVVEDSEEDNFRFEISLSEIGARATFLLDTKRGASWQLTEVTDDKGQKQDMWISVPLI